MKDRQVQYPNRFRLAAVSGQENVYDITPVPGTVTQAGTALNKANLLSDATAALLGLTGDPSVNDALAMLYDKVANHQWSLLGSATVSSTVNTLVISLPDYLDNYTFLHIYSSILATRISSNTAYVYVAMGATGEGGTIAHFYSGLGGATSKNSASLAPMITQDETGELYNFSAQNAGTSEFTLSDMANIARESYHYNRLYIFAKSNNQNTTLTSGTIKIWGWR